MHSRRYLSKKYDELFDRAVEVVSKHNPCKLHDFMGEKMCARGDVASNGLCCHGCRHLRVNGCKVKSLGCKIWLCTHENWDCPRKNIAGPYWQDMMPILKEAEALRLSFPRHSKDETLDAVMTGRLHRGCRDTNEKGHKYYPYWEAPCTNS